MSSSARQTARRSQRFWQEEGKDDGSSMEGFVVGPSSNRNSRLYLERRDENSNPGAVGANQKMVNVNLQHVDDVEDAAAATPQASSELRRLPFAVESVSHSCPNAPASSLTEDGKTTAWKGGAGDGWVLLRLQEKALLSFLRVRNRSTTEISISISVAGKKRRNFVSVKTGVRLAHSYSTDVAIGHLPCLYIRVACRREGSGGVSLHELVPVGIPTAGLRQCMGSSMESLTYKSTESLLFGPSLRTSQPAICPTDALRRLALPPSHLRPSSDEGLRLHQHRDHCHQQAGEGGAGQPPQGHDIEFPRYQHYDYLHHNGVAGVGPSADGAAGGAARSGEHSWVHYLNPGAREKYDGSAGGYGGDVGRGGGEDGNDGVVDVGLNMRRGRSNGFYPDNHGRRGGSPPDLGFREGSGDSRNLARSRQPPQIGRDSRRLRSRPRPRPRPNNQENEYIGLGGGVGPETGRRDRVSSYSGAGGAGDVGGRWRGARGDSEGTPYFVNDKVNSIFSARTEKMLHRRGPLPLRRAGRGVGDRGGGGGGFSSR